MEARGGRERKDRLTKRAEELAREGGVGGGRRRRSPDAVCAPNHTPRARVPKHTPSLCLSQIERQPRKHVVLVWQLEAWVRRHLKTR